MTLDETTCHGAVEAKDRRYDGLFFIGVTSTGVYCRCVCPARTPKRENRTFHLSAAAAEKAGFRPCLLCRPELAPGAAPIDAAARLAHDAVKRIEAGALEEQGLEDLAADLGVTDRHLRRVMLKTFGAAPVEIAQTHRLLTAKRLLKETDLSMTQIAFASGFQSLRRFNALFLERYGMAPSRVRGRGKAPETLRDSGGLAFTLAPRGAFEGASALAHLQLRRASRVETQIAPLSWTRTLQVGPHAGWLRLDLAGAAPRLTLSDGLLPAFRQIISNVRGALDLDADLDAINGFLARDFAADIERDPIVRLPGGLDPFELAVRAIIGQQVTVKAATTVVSRLVEKLGAPIETDVAGLDRLFPSAARIADSGKDAIAALGMPGARAETLIRLARAFADGKLKLARGAVAAGREGLAAIPGVGPWTIEYVALRGLGDPDAFPLGDSALRAAYDGDLARAHERWRPWRAYAAARLWRRPIRPKERLT
ncbi:MAG: DNA-3-methyladenine glycosylase 2 family protein [Hydrogenophilaceae bacterium]|jgi:AraC family transcriptional regulator of adaptative response / DNA-3-methyladenine glycosylase II|nr:DNA-3-methyladenine glycosylase 2 family protein [Hydrogenophilaceae bacterium]